MSDDAEHTADILVHAGRPARAEGRQVNLPIELGSTMVFDTLAAFEKARDHRYESGTLYYGRYGNTASFELERMLASLDKAEGITLTSSGVAAISLSLLSLCSPGQHLLVADHVYGNTRAFCDTLLQSLQIEVEYFDPMMGSAISSLMRDNTAAVMFEAPGSGTFEFPDIRAITTAASERAIATVLDSTWASSEFCTPLALGVDVLVYSASKHVCGHSDCMLGVIAARKTAMHTKIRKTVMSFGDKTGAQEIYLALRGLRTLKLRMQHANAAGLAIAMWLAERAEVKYVLHPALPNCPGHDFWQRDCRGSAALFSVVFHACTREQLRSFVDALTYFSIGVSWGGFESLVLPVDPVRTATNWNETGQLIRFNIGLEDPDSLKKDLASALVHLDKHLD